MAGGRPTRLEASETGQTDPMRHEVTKTPECASEFTLLPLQQT